MKKDGINLEPLGWGMLAFAIAAVLIVAILSGEYADKPTCADGLVVVKQEGRELTCEREVRP